MSKAFTSEETVDAPVLVRARAPLPDGVQNYVTARGLGLLREELHTLEKEHAHELAKGHDIAADPIARGRQTATLTRLTELQARINSAVAVEAPVEPDAEIRFGATVTVRDQDGHERIYSIVGVDEADARAGRVAFVSPVARALLGRTLGQTATVTSPRGEEELEVVAVRYDVDDGDRTDAHVLDRTH